MLQAWLDQRWPHVGLMDPTKAPRRRHRNTGARRGSGLFTELFTVHHTVVTIASAPEYGHFGSPASSTGPEVGGGAHGGVLEWRKFSPVITEVISKTLKDRIIAGGACLTKMTGRTTPPGVGMLHVEPRLADSRVASHIPCVCSAV